MNLYHCMVELKDPDRSLEFAAAASTWFDYLSEKKMITSWRILRRKFGLASGHHTDFLLEIEVENMAELERAFSELSTLDDDAYQKYTRFHDKIAEMKTGLYRPYPDPQQRERIALV